MKKLLSRSRAQIVLLLSSLMVYSCTPNGERKDYYPNGKLKTVQHWQHGKREGAFIDYYPNGNKSVEIHYFNDKIDLSISYAEDGDTLSMVEFIDGQQSGLTRAFHDRSVVAREVEFVQGYEDGNDIAYYPNGIVKHKGQNALGVKSGPWHYYNENGQLIKVEHWEKGQLQRVDEQPVEAY